MSWYKQANTQQVIDKIKYTLKESPFIQELMSSYDIPLTDIDNNLDIEIKELDGKFAEGNGVKIVIDPKLFDEDDFFENQFHFVVHEIFHWIKRRSEDKFYFNDEEEGQSFVLAIMWELMHGKTKKDVYRSIFPIVAVHFDDSKSAKKTFDEMCEKACKLVDMHNNE